ncbi:tRNA (adenine(58)-N(1))-methyltransferase non-catalytic subunit trm6-like isoform X2 [Triticum dicoccoides]|uniref:tRNA (adenine(58)-N(1))-methyltransferase non-catalytic subunit trm6-like isoform X2 n=1 Tax=Triticum dicoccoides TaxID=85692 RepID=UPI00188FAA56|nr:tRNA (adenine(58)-N(1))-methyltransferase non-catalytic subunit trm6-like isoform X2 [Triticum dicoccoides]
MAQPPPPTPTAVMPREAWEGCSVLLDINDGDRLAFFRLTPGATVKIGDKSCSLQPLLGRPFGSLFRVGPDGLLPCQDDKPRDGGDAEGQPQDETRDNRSLVDNNTAQTLSSKDIEAMKREGASGDAIVEALIANSSTFGNKTVFSQEKYKLKKQKKYAPKVLLRRPSTRSICETYFKKYPARIGFMQVDTLSLLLSMANVGAYSDVLAVDMVGGLVVGAVAERLGGTGYVCSTYLGSGPSSIDIIRMYNLNSEMTSRIFQAPLSDLCSLKSSGNAPGSVQGDAVEPSAVPDESLQSSLEKPSDTEVSDGNAQSTTAQPIVIEAPEPATDEHLNQGDISMPDCKGNNGNSIAPKAPRARKAPSQERMKYWGEHGFSSLIVAAPGHEVESVVADLLPLLSYSAPFAIYHQYLQPLATCMHSLQVSKMAIGLQITEPWLREYQVLPSRSHPHMQMNAFGGYILSGIRVHKPNPSGARVQEKSSGATESMIVSL